MPDVKQVTVIVANPSSRRSDRSGPGYNRLLRPGGRSADHDGWRGGPGTGQERREDHAQAGGRRGSRPSIAKRLTMKIYRMVRGDGMVGFHRPLSYPQSGFV